MDFSMMLIAFLQEFTSILITALRETCLWAMRLTLCAEPGPVPADEDFLWTGDPSRFRGSLPRMDRADIGSGAGSLERCAKSSITAHFSRLLIAPSGAEEKKVGVWYQFLHATRAQLAKCQIACYITYQ